MVCMPITYAMWPKKAFLLNITKAVIIYLGICFSGRKYFNDDMSKAQSSMTETSLNLSTRQGKFACWLKTCYQKGCKITKSVAMLQESTSMKKLFELF